MPHYLPPAPAGGAQFLDPRTVPAFLCSTYPFVRLNVPRGGFTRDPRAVTCALCKAHPRFPHPAPPLLAVTCEECGRTVQVPRKPGRRRVTCSDACYQKRRRLRRCAMRSVEVAA